MTMRVRVIALCAAAATAASVGCHRPGQEPKATTAPPFLKATVGPVPGAVKTPILPPNPFAGHDIAAREGRGLFLRFNCAGCHGDHGGGGMGPSLRDVRWFYGSADAQIFSSIAEGRAHGMPAWGVQLTEEEIWKLVAYIKTLRTSAEPEPPR
jgi:cytochrome c oxidase cbb3-type subunit III